MACSAALRVSRESQPALHAADLVVARLECSALSRCKAIDVLSADERDRAARFLAERERDRFIVARATLRRLLGERLGVPADAVRLRMEKHGKPALAWPFAASGLRFNVSHSEGLAVYGFAWQREIGVDVEALREVDGAEAIARRFFSRRESQAFLALPPADRPVAFLNCWTRKEAFIKAIGEGLSHPLGAFDVSLEPGQPASLLRVGERPGHESGWALHAFDPAPGFVGAFVVQVS